MEALFHVAIAASLSLSVLSVVAVVYGRSRARLIEEQIGRCLDRCSSLNGYYDAELARRDDMVLDMSKAIVVLDKRIQRTLADPILALDEEGKLIIWDGVMPLDPPTGGDGNHA